MAPQRGVEGEVEQEAKGGAQQLRVLAGNQERQLLHGRRLSLWENTQRDRVIYVIFKIFPQRPEENDTSLGSIKITTTKKCKKKHLIFFLLTFNKTKSKRL